MDDVSTFVDALSHFDPWLAVGMQADGYERQTSLNVNADETYHASPAMPAQRHDTYSRAPTSADLDGCLSFLTAWPDSIAAHATAAPMINVEQTCKSSASTLLDEMQQQQQRLTNSFVEQNVRANAEAVAGNALTSPVRISHPSASSSLQQQRQTSETRPQPKRARREQYRSCDQCRTSKRKCDMRCDQDNGLVTASCSSCAMRGDECTSTWLQDQLKRKQQRTVIAAASKNIRSNDLAQLEAEVPSRTTALAMFSPHDHQLANTMTASTVSRRHSMIYFQTFELPFSHWLARDCIPPPHSAGLDVVKKDSLQQAFPSMNSTTPSVTEASSLFQIDFLQSWWTLGHDRHAGTPQLLRALHVADALLLSTTFGGDQQRRRRFSGRLSTEPQAALHLAVLCSAAQYRCADDSLTWMLWHEARKCIFAQLDTTMSFRLAWAMIAFGTTAPPQRVRKADTRKRRRSDEYLGEDELNILDDDDDDGEEVEHKMLKSALFSFTEGLQRLGRLCRHMRARLRRVGKTLPSHDVYRIDELTGAFEWMHAILDSVHQVTTRSCTSMLPLTDADVDQFDDNASDEPSFDATGSNCDCSEDKYNGTFGITTDGIATDSNRFLLAQAFSGSTSSSLPSSSNAKMWNSVVERSLQWKQSTIEWPSMKACAAQTIALTSSMIRQASSLKALLWKAVADYVRLSKLYLRVSSRRKHCGRCRHHHKDADINENKPEVLELQSAFVTASHYIQLWHSTFGPAIQDGLQRFSSLPKSSRSMLTFLCNHVSLATLHFFDVAEGTQRSMPPMTLAQAGFACYDLQECFLTQTDRRMAIEAAQMVARLTELNCFESHDALLQNDHQHFSDDGQRWCSDFQTAEASSTNYPDLWHHPYPAMLVQAQHMAAFRLLTEASLQRRGSSSSSFDSSFPTTSPLTKSAKTCLSAIRFMRRTFASYPAYAVDARMRIEDLEAMAASFNEHNVD